MVLVGSFGAAITVEAAFGSMYAQSHVGGSGSQLCVISLVRTYILHDSAASDLRTF
jgi:hypothetical protein